MTRQELFDRVTSLEGTYARETVRLVLQDEVTDPDGQLERMRFGVFRLRPPGRPTGRRKVARDWVLDALVSLDQAGRTPVTRREVEQQLAVMGLRYSGRR